jgi:small subunit ribosomal protein S20
MNKKQRNRKNVMQNKRNKMINRRYISTIKTFFKMLSSHMLKAEDEKFSEKNNQKKASLVNSLYSIIDKSVKKGVIHKNTAARKKSKIFHISSKR